MSRAFKRDPIGLGHSLRAPVDMETRAGFSPKGGGVPTHTRSEPVIEPSTPHHPALPSIYDRMSEQMKATFDSLLGEEIKEESKGQEEAILKLVEQLLAELEATNEPLVDDPSLTEAALEKIRLEIEALLQHVLHGRSLGEGDAVRLLLYTVRERLARTSKKRKALHHEEEKEEDPSKYMNEKQMKAFKQHLQKMMFYEIYKFMTPNQVAGESRGENFMHNMVRGGLQLAAFYAGDTPEQAIHEFSKILGHSALAQLEKLHKEFAHSPTEFAQQAHAVPMRGTSFLER